MRKILFLLISMTTMLICAEDGRNKSTFNAYECVVTDSIWFDKLSAALDSTAYFKDKDMCSFVIIYILNELGEGVDEWGYPLDKDDDFFIACFNEYIPNYVNKGDYLTRYGGRTFGVEKGAIGRLVSVPQEKIFPNRLDEWLSRFKRLGFVNPILLRWNARDKDFSTIVLKPEIGTLYWRIME